LLALGAVPFVGVLAQALIGGITVLTALNPTVVAIHFLVSMALIAGSTLLLLVAVPGSDPTPARPAPLPARRLAAAAAMTATVVLALGTMVTGSGPHSGDAEDPNRFGFDIPLVTRLHSGSVWLFVLLAIALALVLRRRGGPAQARRWSLALLLVTLGQGVIGYLQYALGVPVGLVAVHMLGASLFTITTTATAHTVLRRVQPAPAATAPMEAVR
jgi:heme a synthase